MDLGAGNREYYTYTMAGGKDFGVRTRKVTEKAGGNISDRIYIGDFEIYRERTIAKGVELERETLHLQDDKGRIALVETLTVENSSLIPHPSSLIRFQLSNHLGSATLELDETAALISYEEYYPFGASSYRAGRSDTEVKAKRYRYVGKERDESTGLDYYGARYYVSWLGRWCSADPGGFVDGLNLFAYVLCNPIKLTDKQGYQSVTTDNSEELELLRKEGEKLKSSYFKDEPKYMKLNINSEEEGGVISGEITLSDGNLLVSFGFEKKPVKDNPDLPAIEKGKKLLTPRLANKELLKSFPEGSLQLYSSADVDNLRKKGWVFDDTKMIEKPLEEFEKAKVKSGNGRISPQSFDEIWGPPSRNLVLRTTISGTPVEHNNLKIGSGSIQDKYERPARIKGGTIGGFLGMFSGVYTAVNPGTDNKFAKSIIIPFASAEVTGGMLFAAGAIAGVTESMAMGSLLMRMGGGIAISASALYNVHDSYKKKDYRGTALHGLGVLGGALTLFPATAPIGAAILIAYGVGLLLKK